MIHLVRKLEQIQGKRLRSGDPLSCDRFLLIHSDLFPCRLAVAIFESSLFSLFVATVAL